MTPNSAYKLVPIVTGTDYSTLPTPIYALLCTDSVGVGNIKMRALGDTSDVTIPANAFKIGVTYYIYLKVLVDDDGGSVKFVGHQYQSTPMVL